VLRKTPSLSPFLQNSKSPKNITRPISDLGRGHHKKMITIARDQTRGVAGGQAAQHTVIKEIYIIKTNLDEILGIGFVRKGPRRKAKN